MNLHVRAFGKLSEEQQSKVQRAVEIRKQEGELYDEIQTIFRELRHQGINLWDEMRHLDGEGK